MTTGVNLAMYRAYDPELGRWLSRDPLRDAELRLGPILYEYCYNNPVYRRDSLGLTAGAAAGVWAWATGGSISVGGALSFGGLSLAIAAAWHPWTQQKIYSYVANSGNDECEYDPPYPGHDPNDDDAPRPADGSQDGNKNWPWGDASGNPYPGWQPKPGGSDRPDDYPGPGDPGWQGADP